jgi:hypothetical protein
MKTMGRRGLIRLLFATVFGLTLAEGLRGWWPDRAGLGDGHGLLGREVTLSVALDRRIHR